MFIVIAAIALTWLLWMPLHFRFKQTGQRALNHITKIIPTLSAAAFAGYACIALKQTNAYSELIFVGLIVCALADWLLGVRFEVGGGLFFLGHVFYVLALAEFRALSWWSLTIGVVALAAFWYFLSHYRAQVSNKLISMGLTVYSVALAALLAFSLPLPFLAPSRRSILAAVGAVLFVVSDLTLCHNTTRKKPDSWHFVSLGIYYMGQFLLALSAFPDLM